MTQTLGRLLKSRREEGVALPSPFPKLEALGAKFRRGSLSLIVAAPGRGKSAFATHFATNSFYEPDEGVPSMYFSLDTDRMSLGMRVAAGLKNAPVNAMEQELKNESSGMFSYLDSKTDHIWWVFEPGPSFQDIDLEVDAYAHVQGEYPHLIVIDNLMDIYTQAEDERSAHGDSMSFLNELARRTSAHVMVLAHAKGQYENGDVPIPLGGPLNNIGKKPRLVLTLFQSQPGIMTVCIVKNSSGAMDPNAGLRTSLAWLPERSFLVG